jgi:hypothetical protein
MQRGSSLQKGTRIAWGRCKKCAEIAYTVRRVTAGGDAGMRFARVWLVRSEKPAGDL